MVSESLAHLELKRVARLAKFQILNGMLMNGSMICY